LGKSWILVNTAAREGLPNAFIEAAAHQCAILSAVDPDGFSSQFGHLVLNDDFAAGLRALLQDDLWKKRADDLLNDPRGYRAFKVDIHSALGINMQEYIPSIGPREVRRLLDEYRRGYGENPGH
jgi:hypothetical protein